PANCSAAIGSNLATIRLPTNRARVRGACRRPLRVTHCAPAFGSSSKSFPRSRRYLSAFHRLGGGQPSATHWRNSSTRQSSLRPSRTGEGQRPEFFIFHHIARLTPHNRPPPAAF